MHSESCALAAGKRCTFAAGDDAMRGITKTSMITFTQLSASWTRSDDC
jgi:hypothetical protein